MSTGNHRLASKSNMFMCCDKCDIVFQLEHLEFAEGGGELSNRLVTFDCQVMINNVFNHVQKDESGICIPELVMRLSERRTYRYLIPSTITGPRCRQRILSVPYL